MVMDERTKWNTSTKINHPQVVNLLPGNKPLLQPIYQTAKFTPSDNFPYSEQYIYSRISNPTIRSLELTLAELQKKEDCLVMASGIAAITGTFLALLKQGDHFITFREIYKPSRVFFKDFLPKYGIGSTFLNMSEGSSLEQHIKKETRLIYFESPSNPNLSIADINEIIRVARKHQLLVVMDGTFGGPHQHTDFDIDLMIHSLTKYVNGHGDVIAGSVAGSKEVIKTIKETASYIGATLDPHAANLISRGLKTYLLRFERQCQTALKLATYLEKHPRIKRVIYPGLASHPKHDLAREQMTGMGGIIAFELTTENMNAVKFCHALKLIQFTASLGSTESLICPSELFFGLDLSSEEREKLEINSHSIRLSVGLEDFDDLVRDLDEALRG